jgi:hypothetical protein
MVNLFGNPFDPRLAALCCQVLSALRTPANITAIQNLIFPLLGGTSQTISAPASDTTPGWVAMMRQGYAAVFIAGVSTLRQGLNTVAGYAGDPQENVNLPTNSYFIQMAQLIIDAVSSAANPATTRFFLCGHSLGGAVAETMERQLKRDSNPATCNVVTIGSPKPYNKVDAIGAEAAPLGRWFCEDDPIPLVIPTFIDTPGVLLFFDTNEIRRFENFCQPKGGMQVKLDNTIGPAQVPATASVTFVSSIAAFLLSCATNLSSPHSPEIMLARLLNWIAANPLPSAVPQKGGAVLLPTSSSKTAHNAAERALQAAIQAAQFNADSVPVVIPAVWRFQAVRLRPVWGVSFAGNVVTVCTTKRGARALARLFNQSFRKLQSQAIVNTTTLSSALAAYVVQAATVGSGFQPTMNVEQPAP